VTCIGYLDMTDPILAEVIQILRRYTAVADIGPSFHLKDAGIDSLVLAEVVLALEAHFALRFSGEQMIPDTFESPRSIAAAICAIRSL